VLSYDEILLAEGLNTVTFSDPYARLCFTTMITRSLTHSTLSNQNKKHKRVLYIDTDTTFTAYLMAGLILNDNYQTSNDLVYNHRHSSSDQNHNNINNKNKCDRDADNDYNSIITAKCKGKDERLIQAFLPSEGRFESLLGEAIASMPEASIVIFDSINSFYNMYPARWYESEIIEQPSSKKQQPGRNEMRESDKPLWKSGVYQKEPYPNLSKGENASLYGLPEQLRKENGEAWSTAKSPYTTGRLNHLLSIYIMLLVQHGLFYKIPVLVTSMVRYKRVSADLRVKAPACRRLLNQKSLVRLSVEMINDNDLAVKIMKHPAIVQQTVVYPDVGISLVSP
jgi:hypothetical protein